MQRFPEMQTEGWKQFGFKLNTVIIWKFTSKFIQIDGSMQTIQFKNNGF